MTYTTTRNEQYNSFEIAFDGIPDKATRETLKANGYKWHGVKKVWYGYKDIADVLNGAENASDSPKTQNSDTDREQRQLIQKYADLYGGNDKKSVDYMRGAVAYVVKLDDGTLYAIDKPKIEKDFCFSSDNYGRPTEESEREAEEMAHYARTQESYFINQNLTPILEQAKKFDRDSITDSDDYYLQRYRYKKPYAHNGQYSTDGIAWVEFVDDYANSDKERAEALAKGFRPLTDNEIAKIIDGYKIVIEQHKKRIAAYLKRYGLKHLNVWTYYSD